jgi:hypothetical protein
MAYCVVDVDKRQSENFIRVSLQARRRVWKDSFSRSGTAIRLLNYDG